MALTAAQIYSLARQAGFDADVAVNMVAIAFVESEGNPSALNPYMWTRGQPMNRSPYNGKTCNQAYCGDYSLGLWQINMRPDLAPQRLSANHLANREALYDPATNARVAYWLWQIQGYGAWTSYNTAKFRANLPKAQQARADVEGSIAPLPDGLAPDGSAPDPSAGDITSLLDLSGLTQETTYVLLGGAALVALLLLSSR